MEILIVDDELVSRRKLQKIMKDLGNCQSVENGEDALRLAMGENSPDLILLDIDMPGMDGFEVCKKLKAKPHTKDIPVIFLTAHIDINSITRGFELGAVDYITKPFHKEEVKTRVRTQLSLKKIREELQAKNIILENQNEILEEKVRERTKELQDTRLEIIRRLTIASEQRDNETGQHIIRMSKMCALVGQAFGMSDGQCDLLLHASPMHDIGKIGIPDKVLLKPGKLDPDEWEIMKTHTTLGEKILSGHGSELMKMARLIAITHHEKWDGTGYPQGLKGEDIPLVGRICALCDVFDALTSNRPYKKAWSIEDSLKEINRNKAKSFDPRLVVGFNNVQDDIVKITKEYYDT